MSGWLLGSLESPFGWLGFENLFGQDQLVVPGQAQSVMFTAMLNHQFAPVA